MEWFKIEDGIAVFDKPAIAIYPNIKKLLARDVGGKVTGDPDGRKKLYAFREMTYVYFKCDYRAYPAQHGLTENEAHLYAAKQANLGKDYKPDDLVLAICKQYTDEHLTQAKHSIKTLIRVFALNEKIVEKIEKNLRDSLQLETLSAPMITELLNYQNALIKIASDIPDIAKKLKTAMNLLEEEERVKEITRGGAEKLDSMDPNNAIESDN